VLGDVEEGSNNLIDRRMRQRAEEAEQEEKQRQQEEYEKQRAELIEFRAQRWESAPLTDAEGMLQYLLDTELNEMEFELVRCKPHLIEMKFDDFMEQKIADLEASGESAVRLGELTDLKTAMIDFISFMEGNVKAMAEPAERLKKLLSSKNLRQTINQMAGDNELDAPLLALLQTNANYARDAGQEDAAEFMEKILAACKKFVTLK